MSVTATRTINIVYSGDVAGQEIISAASNVVSPGQVEVKSLSSGANSITVPTMTGFVPTAVTIVPPSGNTTSITFKGISGDTGIRIHNTDPTSIALDSSVTTFVLTTGGAIVGVRLYWS